MKTHFLKVVPEYFEALAEGKKGFGIRKDDRDYKEGDRLVLEEYNPEKREYTGRAVTRKIIYVLRNAEQYGLREGFCILQIEKLHKNHKRLPEDQTQNQQGWIPTSEGTPKKNMACLVSVGKLNLRQIAMYSDLMGIKDHKIFYQGTVGCADFVDITEKVNAWMPLPKPYKGEAEKMKEIGQAFAKGFEKGLNSVQPEWATLYEGMPVNIEEEENGNY